VQQPKPFIMKRLTFLLCLFGLMFQLNAQEEQAPSPLIFIYDASGSMWGQMQGKTKMEIAANVLSSSIDNLPENQKLGLVAYGHREKSDCEDVEFLVAIENGTKDNIKESLKAIKPLGRTPLAFSALQVIDKLRQSKMKATIILVTDGIESCGGNICDVIKAAKEEGIDFRLHIIGFGLKANETEQLKCAAKAGDGQYYDAANAGGLEDVLDEATAITVDDPPGNFSVYAIKNGQAIDVYVKAYKSGTKTDVDLTRTYRDTSYLYLPQGSYDLEVKPLEGSDINAITISNVQSFDDRMAHQTISFDGGKIQVSTLNNGEGWDATANVFIKETGKSVSRSRTYGKTREMEVSPGIYAVEFQGLVIKGLETKHTMENVEIKAGEVTKVQHNFRTGIALIGAKSATGLVDATINIKEVNSGTNVANGRTYTGESSNPKEFILNPGTYTVTLTALGEHKGKKETFAMVVKQGETVEKIIGF